ncbi:MAG: serine/threonine protein kinase [Myxococcaceae bacterium]|nr:serine/threonine protein kinase [Myxococcaceae bacterium]
MRPSRCRRSASLAVSFSASQHLGAFASSATVSRLDREKAIDIDGVFISTPVQRGADSRQTAGCVAGTVDLKEPRAEPDDGLGRTQVSGENPVVGGGPSRLGRTTVLPAVDSNGSLVSLARDRFEVRGTLGAGAMGEVTLAQDRDMGRSIAVKHLTASNNPDWVRRFIGEIRTVAQLEHPNIVPVYDVGLDATGRFFFVMKHVEGQTLEALISRLQTDAALRSRWSYSARARLFLSVLNAVMYAHQRGVLHRDLKPANIIVGAFGEVTVMDWGVATTIAPCAADERAAAQGPIDLADVAPVEAPGQVVGTPLYMSPEQARGEALDHRSDLYALGAIFYELMFLEHYLVGCHSLHEVLEGVQKHEAVAQGPGRTVPPEYGWFLERCLKKRLTERFQTANQMRDELERVMAGKCRVQCQRTAIKRVVYEMMAFTDRHPTLAIVGTTGIACVALGLLVNALLKWLG